ncbi:hypothetical protein HEQ62_03275 [Haematospirillum jordaniae]|uniref:Uncharacterized protein n=1 Tax=Haematospirillum jordaniae TaxID=1549855 RepID=A0A143DD32_9PROT|nr:hypothetical protein [Haematospirillum jordaniae]AMW34627.1 hypothetical protein AY555_04910 [Haematospirillum jordaniae]NKD44847.1 hypothetical protein [Haematospirillum jordaniae]NKD57038.1 hypothetical protein [Haematospirillum jordaniae]NKD58806.1 hypothetical protein [Haematospirillum jordaniae]NKD66963.1 hypothetical protein [Haematospirillum jordaniae]
MELAFVATDIEWHDDDRGLACTFLSKDRYLSFRRSAGDAEPSILSMECDGMPPVEAGQIHLCTLGLSSLTVQWSCPVRGETTLQVEFQLAPTLLSLVGAVMPRLLSQNKRILRFFKA